MICLDLCEKAVAYAREKNLVRTIVLYRVVTGSCECCAEMKLACFKLLWPEEATQ